jgi:DNA-binding NtrC family response regulator
MDNRSPYDDDVELKPTSMAEGVWALLVYDDEDPVRVVGQILLHQGIRTRRARNCSAAGVGLREEAPPVLVLTDTSLPDGSWADVLKAACTVPSKPPVIVVSRLVDIKLYLDVLESGGYDFVVPPVTSADLAYIVSGVLLKGRSHSPGGP